MGTRAARSSNDDDEGPWVSTLELTTREGSMATTGRLCGALCHALRTLRHPVVNDRWCRNEFASLPRGMRHAVKNRLCIGCYQVRVHLSDDDEDVRVEVPPRWLSAYWSVDSVRRRAARRAPGTDTNEERSN